MPDPDIEVAQRHFRRATQLYGEAKYEEAIAAFEAARLVKPAAAFDWNIGRCAERLGQWARAVEAYEQYVKKAPNAEDTPGVKARILVLQERVRAEQARTASPERLPEKPPATPSPAAPEPPAQKAPTPEVAKPEPPTPRAPAVAVATHPATPAPGRTLRITGLAVGVAGALLVLGGGAANAVAVQAGRSIASDAANARPFNPADELRGHRSQAAAIGLYAVGGAALVTGIALYVVGHKRGTRDHARVGLSPWFAHRGGGATLTVSLGGGR